MTAPSVGKSRKLKRGSIFSFSPVLDLSRFMLSSSFQADPTSISILLLNKECSQNILTTHQKKKLSSCLNCSTALQLALLFFMLCSDSQTEQWIAKQAGRAVLQRPPLSRIDFLNVRVPDVLLAFPV